MASFVDPASSSAASQRADESDLDPAAFLKTVRELSEKREREDNERYRALEAEIEKSRRDRAARREERARSVSPKKGTAPSTPIASTNAAGSVRTPQRTNPPPSASTPSNNTTATQASPPEVPEFTGFGSSSQSKMATPSTFTPVLSSTTSESPVRAPSSATSLARSGTLSWQQRPASRAAASRPRSMVVADPASPVSNAPVEGTAVSRDQIAASLGARDPSWFKQTADRGVGNAAFRRNVDDTAGVDSFASGRRGLPGMQRETPATISPAPTESAVSESPPYSSYTATSSQFSTIRTSTSSKPDLKALIAEDEAQAKASPMVERTGTDGERRNPLDPSRTPTMSSSQARLANATERSPSPTKGMGGFVQSAMLKRSDSVTKRWSAQPGASLSRQESSSGLRSELANSYSMPKLEASTNRNETTTTSSLSSNNLSGLVSSEPQAIEGSTAFHSRSRSNVSATGEGLASPSSPSKRWSPTKSTWLESAISRPESPKPSSVRNSQPSWMADIAKAKAQRATGDNTPKQLDESNSRPSSPTKQLAGTSALSRSASRDIISPPSLTPKPVEQQTFASTSPSRSLLNQQNVGSTSSLPDMKPSPIVLSSSNFSDPRSASETSTAKPKPEAPSKPQTDFRSNLRPRSQAEAKQSEAPEFLSKFGALRKTTTQNYVAPDVLKDNILRGKADLAKTSGPVKSERKDELKESLLAKKEQWKKDKDEGVVHERKANLPPITPQKPEALAKRELLGKTDAVKVPSQDITKPSGDMPEALLAQRNVRQKAATDSSFPELRKQTSAPVSAPIETAPIQPKKQTSTPVPSHTASPVQATGTSRMAARFNPGLAGMLARGPPASTNGSSTSLPFSDSSERNISSGSRDPMSGEPPAEGGQLQDMRKGRAKGPKKRRGATREADSDTLAPDPSYENVPTSQDLLVNAPIPTNEPADAMPFFSKPKPQALPGSAASLMRASLQQSAAPGRNRKISGPRPMVASPSSTKPAVFTSSTSVSTGTFTQPGEELADNASSTPTARVPEFRGFGSARATTASARLIDDDKENAGDGSRSVKSAASKWGSQNSVNKAESPGPIKLPSKKDEEAAMRSAGLLASSSSRPGSSNGNVQTPPLSAGVPQKPSKSSRAVSGQLQEASPSKSSLGWFDAPTPKTAVHQELRQAFGTIPKSLDPLSIDTQGVINHSPHPDRIFKTIRKSVQVLLPDSTLKELPQEQEYTFFDESVYIFTHVYSVSDGPKKTEMFLWSGDSSPKGAAEQAEIVAKRLSKDIGSAYVHAISQGLEPPGFLQALGGILITRRGSHQSAPKQYMLRGRKHLGQITFDEVDFSVQSLQSGFAYLISFATTLTETRLYLWKGSAASAEEISAARLAAADLSQTHEIIEVDDGVEFASFLKIFGPGTTKASIERPGELWLQKARSPDNFTTRLFGIQPGEAKAGLFSNIFTRRPSWGNVSPSRKDEPLAKIVAREISPFTQSDLEADRIYVLDAYSSIYILVGLVFAAQPESVRNLLLGQTLRFASEYAVLASSISGRPSVPNGHVVLSGVPDDAKFLFRHWDEQVGLWGTGGLLAGVDATRRHELKMLDLKEVLDAVCDV